MFLSTELIQESLQNLEGVHPFYGITFLVCKRINLPIGDVKKFRISAEETRFLDEYYKPVPSSKYFYRVFRPSNKNQHWVERRKYASSTLQAIRTQTVFGSAFVHSTGTDEWGWEEDYVSILRAGLSQNVPPYRNEPIPALYLAAWLFREREWPSKTNVQDIIDIFLSEFDITDAESSLFDLSPPNNLYPTLLFQDEPISDEELIEIIGQPPDAPPVDVDTLAGLELQGVGPSRKLIFAPAERLNLITGDNGLGKSFLLECSWWALTGRWTDQSLQAYPRDDANEDEPKITITLAGQRGTSVRIPAHYDRNVQGWRSPKNRPTMSGLIVYARVDGSFAIWDAVRNRQASYEGFSNRPMRPFLITRSQVWGGQAGIIEGLIRDWVTWQSVPEKHPFEIFRSVLARLSPPDLGILEPGQPRRLPNDPRGVPTLKHPYGEVPILYASAGVRRILTLAYLIVWTWNEHRIASELARIKPQRRMVILIDEMEAHLHPLWQRTILPALLDVSKELSRDLKAQFLVNTHSPLVMASVESAFDDDTDKLFHMDLNSGGEVNFRELQFVRYGSVDAWLTSEVFDLRHARSIEAERAIERAKALQKLKDPGRDDVAVVSQELLKTLAPEDEFWPRWLYFAEQHGVKL